MNTIRSQTEYVFTFRLMSPLLIASEETCIVNVGGEDKSSIIHPLTGKPFIPASSMKGKLRYMGGLLGFEDEQLLRWFGSPQGRYGPSRVNVKSVSVHSVPDHVSQEPFFLKAEASIKRERGEANPRFFQAVMPGVMFRCTLLINEYEEKDQADEIIAQFIEPALALLEDHYIGSGGSRGYGRIKIYDRGKVGDKQIFSKIAASSCTDPQFNRVYMHTPYFSNNKVRSVTLAGCFACAMKTLCYEDEDIATMLKGEHFRITSAFPVIHLKDSKKIHFFPRPHYYDKGIRSHQNWKNFLDFEYISENIFRNFCQKPHFFLTLCNELSQYNVINKRCMTKEEFELIKNVELHEISLHENRDLTHVSINPETGQAQESLLFQTEDHFYSEDAFGFYFLIQHQWNLEELKSILNVIETMGIGKNKSTAKGYFRFTVEPLDSNWHHVKEGKGQFISLSLIHPSTDDRNRLSGSAGSYYTNHYSVW